MPWRSDSGHCQEQRPIRLRLSDGSTITNEAITDEVLTALGWYWDSYYPPEPEPEPEPEIVDQSTSSEITIWL